MKFRSLTLIPLISLPIAVTAAPVVWDGGGNSNDSGTWETSSVWDPDGVPGTADDVTLGDVTTGTRVVTVSSGDPQEVASLTITQNTLGAVNTLTLEDNLTVVSNSSNPLLFSSTAGQDAIVLNVGAGVQFSATRTVGLLTGDLSGSVNLGDGASFTMSSGNDDPEITFNGSLTADPNSSLILSGIGAYLTLKGDSYFGSGSTIQLTFTDHQGNAVLENSGDLIMDGAVLDFNWEAGSSNTGTRNIQNTGTMTFQNNASVVITSSTGRPVDGGFGVTVGSQNSGTFNVESGSSIASRTFFNTGTMNLGSNTGGISDSTVLFGEGVASNIELHNGVTSSGGAGAATMNILGDTIIGNSTPNNGVTLFNGSASSTGSVLNVGDGSTNLTLTLQNRTASLTNYAGNTVNLTANSTVLLKSLLANDTAGAVTFTNEGILNHEGTLQMQGNKSGQRLLSTTSTGTYRIQGVDAVLENNESTSGPTAANIMLNYQNRGILSGASSSDRLTYVNSTSKTTYDVLAMYHIGGSITPGDGSNGAGVASVGSLELVNVDLSLYSGAMMAFDIGGTVASGLFDSLTLSGDGAALDLGTDSVLDLYFVNDFLPSIEETYTIALGAAVSGTFSSLLFNGGALDGEYEVNYTANSIEVTLAAVPEPTSFALLGGLLSLGLVLTGRRRS
ncbi:MAG: beta strand repeat-containing protein [Puniceicoccales bacterium]